MQQKFLFIADRFKSVEDWRRSHQEQGIFCKNCVNWTAIAYYNGRADLGECKAFEHLTEYGFTTYPTFFCADFTPKEQDNG